MEGEGVVAVIDGHRFGPDLATDHKQWRRLPAAATYAGFDVEGVVALQGVVVDMVA